MQIAPWSLAWSFVFLLAWSDCRCAKLEASSRRLSPFPCVSIPLPLPPSSSPYKRDWLKPFRSFPVVQRRSAARKMRSVHPFAPWTDGRGWEFSCVPQQESSNMCKTTRIVVEKKRLNSEIGSSSDRWIPLNKVTYSRPCRTSLVCGGLSRESQDTQLSNCSDRRVRVGRLRTTTDDERSLEEDHGSAQPSSESVTKRPSFSSSAVSRLYKRTPPITKLFVLSSFAITFSSYFLNYNVFPKCLLLNWHKTLKEGQLWRLFTCFLYLGNFSVPYLLTLHFVWTYMSVLERLHCYAPEEFLMLLLFGMVGLLCTYPVLTTLTRNSAFSILSSGEETVSSQMASISDVLGHNLSSYFVYLWSRVYEGQEVSVMDLFHVRAEWLPWFFVLQSWILEGQGVPLLDLLGIVLGGAYRYVSGGPLAIGETQKVDEEQDTGNGEAQRGRNTDFKRCSNGKGCWRAPVFLRKWMRAKWIKSRYDVFREEME